MMRKCGYGGRVFIILSFGSLLHMQYVSFGLLNVILARLVVKGAMISQRCFDGCDWIWFVLHGLVWSVLELPLAIVGHADRVIMPLGLRDYLENCACDGRH